MKDETTKKALTIVLGVIAFELFLLIFVAPLFLIECIVYAIMSFTIRSEGWKKGDTIIDRFEKELIKSGKPALGRAIKYIFFPEILVKEAYKFITK